MTRGDLVTWLKGQGFEMKGLDMLQLHPIRIILKPRVAVLKRCHPNTNLWVSLYTQRYSRMSLAAEGQPGLLPELAKLMYSAQEKSS